MLNPQIRRLLHIAKHCFAICFDADGSLKLRDYQLDGLNWMVYSWSQDRNVILADEMVCLCVCRTLPVVCNVHWACAERN
jgi:hypothetical protein